MLIITAIAKINMVPDLHKIVVPFVDITDAVAEYDPCD